MYIQNKGEVTDIFYHIASFSTVRDIVKVYSLICKDIHERINWFLSGRYHELSVDTKVYSSNISIIKQWIRDPRSNLCIHDNFLLKRLSFLGYKELVCILIHSIPNKIPQQHYNEALILACMRGHDGIVNLLVNFYGVSPNCNNGEALITACRYNQLDVVEVLLYDKDIKVSLQYNKCFYYAVKNKNRKIINLLLFNKGWNE